MLTRSFWRNMQSPDLDRLQLFVPGRVSVITATFNAAAVLPGCVESVAAQDYDEVEHVIIDGGSTDDTLSIIRHYKDDIGYWISEKDRGIYDAWNKGVAASSGEWIAFLGADDRYRRGAIAAYMQHAAEQPRLEYISSQVRWIPSPPEKEKIIGTPWSWPSFQREMRVAHVGSMHHRSLFERLGQYDLSYRITGDYELLLRAKENLCASFLPMITAEMQAAGASDSFEALAEAKRAKISAGRPKVLAEIEHTIKRAKLCHRRLYVALHGA